MWKALSVLAAVAVGNFAVAASRTIGVDATGQPVQYFDTMRPTAKTTTTSTTTEVTTVTEAEPVQRTVARQELDAIYFEKNEANLNDAAKQTLASAAEWLKANPNSNASIEAQADEPGTPQHNLVLSKQRAASVSGYLRSLGVSARRLSTKALGEVTERKAIVTLQ